MKHILGLFLISLVLVGAGCTSDVEDHDATSENDVAPYVGNWERQGTYVDGVLENEYPATLEMKKNTYYSHNALCEVRGSIDVLDDSVSMTVEDTDCPVIPGYETIVYRHTFNDDFSEMTMVTIVDGVEVKEIYMRVTDDEGEDEEETGEDNESEGELE